MGLTILPTSCGDCLESGSLNLLEPSGPVQDSSGIAFLQTKIEDSVCNLFFLLCLYCQIKKGVWFREVFMSGKGLHRKKSLKTCRRALR